jgi:hypothetical protein
LTREVADSLSADGADWLDARETWTTRGRILVQPGPATVDADVTWRQTDNADGTKEITRLARTRLGWTDPGRGIGFNAGYSLSNDASRVLSRQIVFVGPGQGDYDIEGNAVGPGRGDYELLYTPSDSTISSTDVEFDTQFDWRPGYSVLGGFGNSLHFTVREQSTTDEIGRLLWLDPSVLRQTDTTVYGERRLRNDLSMLRKLRRLDLRYSFEEQDLLDQRFVEGPQTRDRLLHELRLEGQFSARWTGWVEADFERRAQENSGQINPLLRGFRTEDRSVATALRWRRGTRARAELAVRYTNRREKLEDIQQRIVSFEPSANVHAIGARWTFLARWAEIREDASDDPVRPYYFEAPGTSRSAGVQAQWGGSGLLSFNFRYQITDEAQRELRQDLGVETRARF